jgi:hypothetical protein
VDSWYEESLAAYNYDKEPPDSSSGMFLKLLFQRIHFITCFMWTFIAIVVFE